MCVDTVSWHTRRRVRTRAQSMADATPTDRTRTGRVLGPDSCVTTPRPDEKCRNPVAVSMTSTVFMHLSPLFPSGQRAIQCKNIC